MNQDNNKTSVYVQKMERRKCPACFVRMKDQKYGSGFIYYCHKCNRRYISLRTYLTYTKEFRCENEQELSTMLLERQEKSKKTHQKSLLSTPKNVGVSSNNKKDKKTYPQSLLSIAKSVRVISSKDKEDNTRLRSVKQGRKEVYVYYKLTNECVSKNHPIESVTVETKDAVSGTKTTINVYYCKKCNKYFINYEALSSYFKRRIYPSVRFKFDKDPENKLSEISQLKMYGYTAKDGELSDSERHKVLAWIIDNGLMTKPKIIKDLQFKVAYNGKKAGNENAKKKWQDDIQFVSHYTSQNKKVIDAVFIRE